MVPERGTLYEVLDEGRQSRHSMMCYQVQIVLFALTRLSGFFPLLFVGQVNQWILKRRGMVRIVYQSGI